MKSITDYRSTVTSYIEKHYAIDEIDLLCLDIGIVEENMRRQTRFEYAKSLFDACVAKDILERLIHHLNTDPQRDSPHLPDPPIELKRLRPTSYIEASVNHVLSGSYDDALRALEQASSAEAQPPLIYVIRAIALMQGKHPTYLLRQQYEKAEASLKKASEFPETRVVALAVLGLIKQERLSQNGRADNSSIDEIAKEIETGTPHLSVMERRLIASVNASEKAKRRLGLD